MPYRNVPARRCWFAGYSAGPGQRMFVKLRAGAPVTVVLMDEEQMTAHKVWMRDQGAGPAPPGLTALIQKESDDLDYRLPDTFKGTLLYLMIMNKSDVPVEVSIDCGHMVRVNT